jgi:hypothetical protein
MEYTMPQGRSAHTIPVLSHEKGAGKARSGSSRRRATLQIFKPIQRLI